MKRYAVPVCKRLFIDSELALIAIRIRQGDFYIIEDYQSYLNILLPNEQVRKLAMSVCGIMTLPIMFNRKFDKYPDQFDHAITFEGACEMLCEMLNINPIVPRMMMFDPDTLSMIEERFGMPKKALAWFVVTLINLPIFVLDGVTLKECKKMLHLKKLQLERMMQELEKEEAKDLPNKRSKDGKDSIVNEKTSDEVKKDDANVTTQHLNDSPEKPLEEVKVDKLPGEVKVEKSPEELKTEKPLEEAKKTPGADEGAAKTGGNTKKLLRLLKASMIFKGKGKEDGNYYDNIDFDTELYDDVNSKFYEQASLSYLNEIFEVLMFNKESYCRMDYDYITSKDRREGI